jgi:RHS repeat-associated protein
MASLVGMFTAKERDQETGLDFFGARYYGSVLGRFTSPDPYNILTRKDQGNTGQERKKLLDSFISNPQAWNKYTYALNAPLHLVDAEGNCSAPAGLKPGQTGVCIETFIAAPRIGGVGLGDNRTFSSTGGTYRFRVDVRVDPGTNGKVSINSDAAMSQVGTPSFNIGLRGKGDAQIGTVLTDDQGNRQFDVTGSTLRSTVSRGTLPDRSCYRPPLPLLEPSG